MSSSQKTESTGRDFRGRFTQGNMMGKGRPVLGGSVAQLIRDLGNEEITVKEAQIKLSRLEATLRRAWVDAMGGNKEAREFIFERGWGKPIQPVVVDEGNGVVTGFLENMLRSMNDDELDRIVQEAERVLRRGLAAAGEAGASGREDQAGPA